MRKDSSVQLFRAVKMAARLRATGASTLPVAVVLGNALGWKWPEGMNLVEHGLLSRLCDLLQVHLPGRHQEVR